MEPTSPLGAAGEDDAAASAAPVAFGEDGAPLTRSPFKRLASRTLSDRWVQELQSSPNELSAREAKSIHFDAPGADGGEQGAQQAPAGDDMHAEPTPLLRLRTSDAAPASPAHAERSEALSQLMSRSMSITGMETEATDTPGGRGAGGAASPPAQRLASFGSATPRAPPLSPMASLREHHAEFDAASPAVAAPEAPAAAAGALSPLSPADVAALLAGAPSPPQPAAAVPAAVPAASPAKASPAKAAAAVAPTAALAAVHAHGTRRSAAAARAAAAALSSASAQPAAASAAATSRRTGFVYDARMADHLPPPGTKHFEQPGRVRAIFARLHREGLVARCAPLAAREATSAELLACHTAEHVAAVDAAVDAASVPPGDDDMYASAGTALAARLAAGCVAAAAKAALARDVDNAFALVRPPGHHAGCCTAMGFCWYNNVAVAARAAQAAGASRVAIVDWDVHHGNGTQDIFWDDPSVLYISLHRFGLGFFPGSGAATETGPASGPAAGMTLNVPFADTHLTGADYNAAFALLVLPVLRAFAPDLVLVSAGFDAALGDPLGKMALTPAAFGALTEALLALEAGPASSTARGAVPLVVALEGGYNEDAIAACAEAVVRALLRGADAAREAAASARGGGASAAAAKRERGTRVATEAAVRAARDAAAPHWPCLREAGAAAAFEAFWAEEREARPRRACAAAPAGSSSSSDATAPHAPGGGDADASPASSRRPSPVRGSPALHALAPARAADAATPP